MDSSEKRAIRRMYQTNFGSFADVDRVLPSPVLPSRDGDIDVAGGDLEASEDPLGFLARDEGRTAPEEGVEDDFAGVGAEAHDVLNEFDGLLRFVDARPSNSSERGLSPTTGERIQPW